MQALACREARKVGNRLIVLHASALEHQPLLRDGDPLLLLELLFDREDLRTSWGEGGGGSEGRRVWIYSTRARRVCVCVCV